MLNVFIYGSCVARDTATIMAESWKVHQYIARQSLLSAARGQSEIEGKVALDSAFQKRMVQFDIAGNALHEMKKAKATTDVILLDIMDERLGVYEVDDGTFLTKSWELERSGFLDFQTDDLPLITFGSDEHFTSWQKAAVRMSRVIAKLETPAFVLAPPLAERDLSGEVLDYLGIPVHEWNSTFDRYYEAMEACGLTVLRPPLDLVVADKNHQWGLAPFHYAEPTYTWFTQQVEDAIAELTAER